MLHGSQGRRESCRSDPRQSTGNQNECRSSIINIDIIYNHYSYNGNDNKTHYLTILSFIFSTNATDYHTYWL